MNVGHPVYAGGEKQALQRCLLSLGAQWLRVVSMHMLLNPHSIVGKAGKCVCVLQVYCCYPLPCRGPPLTAVLV